MEFEPALPTPITILAFTASRLFTLFVLILNVFADGEDNVTVVGVVV